MIEVVIAALVTGFLMAWGFGTVFFSLIQTGIEQGYKKSMNIALGVAVSDAFMIIIAVFGSSILKDIIKKYQPVLGVFGGAALIIFGIVSITKKVKPIKIPKTKFGNFLFYFSTGILLNIINPLNFFAWLIIAGSIFPVLEHSQLENFIFYIIVIGSIFGTESAIGYFAHKVKKFFTTQMVSLINKISGLVYAGVGVYLIYKNYNSVLDLFQFTN